MGFSEPETSDLLLEGHDRYFPKVVQAEHTISGLPGLGLGRGLVLPLPGPGRVQGFAGSSGGATTQPQVWKGGTLGSADVAIWAGRCARSAAVSCGPYEDTDPRS